MAQKNEYTAEVDEGEEVFGFVFVPGDEVAVVLKPGMQAFDIPAPFGSSKWSAILSFGSDTISSMGSNKHNIVLSQFLIEGIGVKGPITNEAIWILSGKSCGNRCFHQGDFTRRSSGQTDGDRKRARVRNIHDL